MSGIPFFMVLYLLIGLGMVISAWLEEELGVGK